MKLAKRPQSFISGFVPRVIDAGGPRSELELETVDRGGGWLNLVMVLLRVNVFVTIPLAFSLAVLSGPWSWLRFGRSAMVMTIFTNTSFAFLCVYYRQLWLRTRRIAHRVLAVLALPILGLVATVVGWAMIALLAPGLLSISQWKLISIGATITAVAGLVTFVAEDNRLRQRVDERALAGSRRREQEASKAKTMAEIVALQALIKPHFVFNTLNSIAALIPEEPEKGEETTIRLAKLLRYLVEIQDNVMVTLGTELDIVEAYLEIEKVRLGDRLGYRIELPAECRATPIPGMVLQPLVENAVEHGIRQRSDPGFLSIGVSNQGAECAVLIVDNGPGFSSHRGSGSASRLLHQRLDRLYGDDYTLSLGRDEIAGETVVELRFPQLAKELA